MGRKAGDNIWLLMTLHSGHMSDSAVDMPVLGLTPLATLQSLIVAALSIKLSEKSAPSIIAPSKIALIRLAFVKSNMYNFVST